MKAMILAAGRGQRLRPLTDHCPKPMVEVAGKTLIEWHIVRLAEQGIRDVVINLSWLGEQIKQKLGDGSHYNVDIKYIDEGSCALETGGGIANALSVLGDEPFLVINADVWLEFQWPKLECLGADELAFLLLVPNPDHHPVGDFSMHDGKLGLVESKKLTFSGVGLYRPELFTGSSRGAPFPLTDVLLPAIERGLVAGIEAQGYWQDVGTLERLQDLRDRMRGTNCANDSQR